MMAQAQHYTDELSVKIHRGMDINAEKCLSTGGNIALGYKVDKINVFRLTQKPPLSSNLFLKATQAEKQ